MRMIKTITAVALATSFVAGPFTALAADKKPVKPYKLDTCAVTDEKLGEMGAPFVFEYQGQEIKLCCKGCKKDFDKDPAKFIKKMLEAEKKAAAAAPAK
jgi:YHS domain-containing protein